MAVASNAQDVAAKNTPATPPKPPAAGDQAASAGKDKAATAKKPLAPTEITSDTLEYDFNKQVVTFAGNVKVVDNQLQLRADKMTVHLDKKSQTVQRIVAVGKVEMKTADGKATGARAEYELAAGRVTLSGEPVIHSPGGLMKGALKVIYDRKAGHFKTAGGNPRLEIRNANTSDAVEKFIKRPGNDGKKQQKKTEPGAGGDRTGAKSEPKPAGEK